VIEVYDVEITSAKAIRAIEKPWASIPQGKCSLISILLVNYALVKAFFTWFSASSTTAPRKA
jgi:hypothetical protein